MATKVGNPKTDEPKLVPMMPTNAEEPVAEPETVEAVETVEATEAEDKLAAIKAEIDALKRQYDNASKLAHGRLMSDAESKIKKKVEEYATESRQNFGEACRKAANPMAEALRIMFYPVVKARPKENQDTKLNEMEVDFDERQIDLKWLHGYITDGIGADKTWLSKVAKLNKGLSAMANGALGKPVADFEASYKISAEADGEQGFLLNETTAYNTLDSSVANDLGIAVKAMIGEVFLEKFKNPTGVVLTLDDGNKRNQTLGDVAVAYIVMSHTSRKRGGGISTARERTMIEAMATLCAYLMYTDDPAKALMLKLGQAKKSK